MIKALGKPKDLKNELRLGDTIFMAFSGVLNGESLRAMKGIYALQTSDSGCRILVDDHHDRLPQILDFLIGEKLFIHDLRVQESDLEDVFIAFTR
jgi:hypothetical protein